jgi:predicted O-methyltransferase YrrM
MNLEENWIISSEKYKIQQKKWEWLSFLELVEKENPTNIMEIGCYDGGTTWGLANLCKNMVTIDAHNPSRFDVEDMKKFCNYTYIGSNSHEISLVEKVKNILGEIDVLFIDGDHTYEGAFQDYLMYSPLVKIGGLVAFHDVVDSHHHRIQNCYVSKAYQQVKKSRVGDSWEFICDHLGNKYNIENSDPADWGGIGIKRLQ